MKSFVRSKEPVNKHAAGFSAANKSIHIQPKLFVSQANHKYEQEATTTADRVTNTSQNNFIQSKLSRQLPEEKITSHGLNHNITPGVKTKSEAGNSISSNVSDAIISSRGTGTNLDNATGSFMSSRFGADFSNVKIHNNSEAAQLSNQLNAKAFTVGNDIYFNEGNYAPNSEAGRHLLAHELTHTIQQGAAPVAVQKEDKGDKTYAPKSEIDFKLLLPDLQLRLFHFLLAADTSKVQFDYETKNFMAGLSYSYGDALSLKMRFSDFTTKLGWKPDENTFSLGLSQGPFSAGIKASPFQSKYGLSLSYGAPLLPMQDGMSRNFIAGGASAGNMMMGLPGLPDDPIAYYQQYKPDIENITKSADLVKQITAAGKRRITFGAGISLTYDPENQMALGVKAGFMF